MLVTRTAIPKLRFSQRRLAGSLVIAVGLVVGLASCATHRTTFHASSMDFGSIQRVAVLPMANLSRETTAAARIRDVLVTMLLASEAFEVVPQGELARALQRIGVREPTAPSTKQILQLSKLVEVDAIFTGVVREYGALRSGQATANVASISLQMHETQTGQTIWSASGTKGGVGFWDRLVGGGGQPMNRVSEQVVGGMLDALFNVSSTKSSGGKKNDSAGAKKTAKRADRASTKGKSEKQGTDPGKKPPKSTSTTGYKSRVSPGSD